MPHPAAAVCKLGLGFGWEMGEGWMGGGRWELPHPAAAMCKHMLTLLLLAGWCWCIQALKNLPPTL